MDKKTSFEIEQERQVEYGRKREAERQRYLKKRDQLISADINRILATTKDECTQEMLSWAFKYAENEGFTFSDALRAAEKADIEDLQRKAREYVSARWIEHDKKTPFTPEANKEMRAYNFAMKMNRMELLYGRLSLAIDKSTDKIEAITHTFLLETGEEELIRQAGLLGLNIITPEEAAKRAEIIAGESFHETTFSEKIWARQDQLKASLEDGIKKTILSGKHPSTWSNTLTALTFEAFEDAAYNQRRIAITESGRVQIAVQKESYERTGYRQYVVICEPSACPICKVHDGKTKNLKDLVQGENAPMFHPWCRCSTSPKMSRAALDEILAAKDPIDINPREEIEEKPAEPEKPKEKTLKQIESFIGQEHAENIRAILDEVDQRLKTLYERIDANFILRVPEDNNQAYYDPWAEAVYLDIDSDTTDTGWAKPYQTFFHETAHMADHKNGVRLTTFAETYIGSNGMTLGETIKSEFDKKIKDAKKRHRLTKNKDAAEKLALELGNTYTIEERASLSDLMDGCRYGIEFPLGFGHGAGYWGRNKKDANMKLGAEAFAEFSAAIATHPDELKALKNELPEAYKIYSEILDQLTN